MKWSVQNIVEFLEIYREYPLLWNLNDKNYCNVKLKDEVFKRLLGELNEKQLIGGMDEKQLKAKIKSIKDVYRQELNKIVKSRKSGAGTDEVYLPKLAWFNEASYLAEVLSTRISKSNLDLASKSEEATLSEGSENSEELPLSQSSAQMRPPQKPLKRFKKQIASDKVSSELSEAIHHLDKIAQNAGEEKPYDQFGKYVASELRQLPQRQAILLQQEIQNSIVRFKLLNVDQASSSSPRGTDDDVFSPASVHTMASPSTSSNDGDEILKRAIYDSFML